jgi:L-lysine exporter family protein LysE/ArgO
MLSAFLHGYLLAFGLILPLGPQNAFVLSQGASRSHRMRALAVVIAAALSDTLLIVLAVLGVSMIVLTLPWIKTALIVFGVLFLAYVGWLTWRSDGIEKNGTDDRNGWSLRRQVAFTLAISLFNPHAILDTIGVIGTSALAYQGNARLAFTAACILNSWLWFLMLSLLGRWVGNIESVRRWLNRASAVVMWGSAAYLLFGLAH